jgi:hypothetical protein
LSFDKSESSNDRYFRHIDSRTVSIPANWAKP